MCLNRGFKGLYVLKSGLRILIRAPEVPFLVRFFHPWWQGRRGRWTRQWRRQAQQEGGEVPWQLAKVRNNWPGCWLQSYPTLDLWSECFQTSAAFEVSWLRNDWKIWVKRVKQFWRRDIHPLVHNCTIFLCSLDVRNIDDISDQCRGPSIKEKDHLVG